MEPEPRNDAPEFPHATGDLPTAAPDFPRLKPEPRNTKPELPRDGK
jgi:hypothetical protein